MIHDCGLCPFILKEVLCPCSGEAPDSNRDEVFLSNVLEGVESVIVNWIWSEDRFGKYAECHPINLTFYFYEK